jgi:hypothetical protein
MKKRFLLSLLRIYGSEKKNSHEYFPNMDYDPSSIGVWFDTMEDALAARDQIKEMGIKAAYSVISYDDPWDLVSEMRRIMLEDKENRQIVIDDDDLILGDRDADELLTQLTPSPIATGEGSITIARLGVGALYFCRDGARMPITLEEAEALARVSPQCVHLYANSKGEEEF